MFDQNYDFAADLDAYDFGAGAPDFWDSSPFNPDFDFSYLDTVTNYGDGGFGYGSGDFYTSNNFGDIDLNQSIDWSEADGLWFNSSTGEFYDVAGFLVENYVPLTEAGSGLQPRDDSGGFDQLNPTDTNTGPGFWDNLWNGFTGLAGGLLRTFSGGSGAPIGGGFGGGFGGSSGSASGLSNQAKQINDALRAAQQQGATTAQLAELRRQLLESQRRSVSSGISTPTVLIAGGVILAAFLFFNNRQKSAA